MYAAPQKPGVVPLRPLMFGELMDGAFQTVRRNPKAMLGQAVSGPGAGRRACRRRPADYPGLRRVRGGLAEQPQHCSDDVPFRGAGRRRPAFRPGVRFDLHGMQGAMVVPVARSILNRRTGFRQMWVLARGRAWALVRLAALCVAAVLLAAALIALAAASLANSMGSGTLVIVLPLVLAFIAGMIWVSVKLTVAPAVIVVEDLGAFDGIRRSWAVTRGSWWRVFGIVLVVSLLVGVIGQIVLIPVSLLSGLLTTVAGQDPTSQAAVLQVVIGVASTAVSRRDRGSGVRLPNVGHGVAVHGFADAQRRPGHCAAAAA